MNINEAINAYNHILDQTEGIIAQLNRFYREHCLTFSEGGWRRTSRSYNLLEDTLIGIEEISGADECDHTEDCECVLILKMRDDDGWETPASLPFILLKMSDDEIELWAIDYFTSDIEAKERHERNKKERAEQAERDELRRLQKKYS